MIFTRGVLSIPACDVYVRLETTGAAIKIARGTTNNQKNKYNSVKRVQRQYFSFTKTSIESKVSLKIMSQVSISLFMFQAGFPVFADLFQNEIEARKSLRAFCLQPNSSEP